MQDGGDIEVEVDSIEGLPRTVQPISRKMIIRSLWPMGVFRLEIARELSVGVERVRLWHIHAKDKCTELVDLSKTALESRIVHGSHIRAEVASPDGTWPQQLTTSTTTTTSSSSNSSSSFVSSSSSSSSDDALDVYLHELGLSREVSGSLFDALSSQVTAGGAQWREPAELRAVAAATLRENGGGRYSGHCGGERGVKERAEKIVAGEESGTMLEAQCVADVMQRNVEVYVGRGEKIILSPWGGEVEASIVETTPLRVAQLQDGTWCTVGFAEKKKDDTFPSCPFCGKRDVDVQLHIALKHPEEF